MLLCGLDYSGKTTLIKKYCLDLENFASKNIETSSKDTNVNLNSEFYYTTPYINIEKIFLPDSSMPCVVYDLSGQGRYRENWSFFYPDVDGILFVVDASDRERLSIV